MSGGHESSDDQLKGWIENFDLFKNKCQNKLDTIKFKIERVNPIVQLKKKLLK